MTPTLPTPAAPPARESAGSDGNGSLLPELPPEVIPYLDDLITEDDAPVESIFAEKQYRLLTEPLYSSWLGPGEERTFLALANVGWFHAYKQPPLVPDFLLGLDVVPAGSLRTKEGHSYFQWLMGKSPDVIGEIVSDRRGGEEDFKMRVCARNRVPYYVIFDPNTLLSEVVLRVYELRVRKYLPLSVTPFAWLEEVGLGLTLWDGAFERQQETWLRWCDKNGNPIPTGAEGKERLAAQLRALGIEPDV